MQSTSSRSAPLPWLVADIGGTNARFGLVREPGGPVVQIRSLKGADHASLQAAVRAYLDAELAPGEAVGRAALAVAAPITDVPVRLTNSHWIISADDIRVGFDIPHVKLLNDFEALALALPHLHAPEDIKPFGNGKHQSSWPKAIIGPGTGLGVAGCVPVGDRWVAVAAEGGHVTVAPADAFELAVVAIMQKGHDHLSAERLLSGTGLPGLHAAVCEVRGEAVQTLTPAEISKLALEDKEPCAVATLDTFCAMLGSFAGNVALTLGARGGVFIGGGIAQRLGDRLIESRFRQRFESKGRMSRYLQDIQTSLVISPHAALTGAAAALR